MEGSDSKDDEYNGKNESEDAKHYGYAPPFRLRFFVIRHCFPKASSFTNIRLVVTTTLSC
jgi:hypothetical protein